MVLFFVLLVVLSFLLFLWFDVFRSSDGVMVFLWFVLMDFRNIYISVFMVSSDGVVIFIISFMYVFYGFSQGLGLQKLQKIIRCEVFLDDSDRRRLLELFDRYARAKEVILEVVRKSPVRAELLRMMSVSYTHLTLPTN